MMKANYESIFESVFMESGGSYCVISKISGEFSGYIEISPQKDGVKESYQ